MNDERQDERQDLAPDTDEAAPQMHYEDLKYPLLQRGLPVPSAMEDYIRGLIVRDMLSDEEIEQIRKEMVQAFQNEGQPVPNNFHENFDTWFPHNKPNKQ